MRNGIGKFRGRVIEPCGWIDVKEGDWIYGYLVKQYATWGDDSWYIFTGMSSVDKSCLNWEMAEVDENTIGEYIEKKDRNGKEIYEKDKVYLYPNVNPNEEIEIIQKGIGIVIKEDAAFEIKQEQSLKWKFKGDDEIFEDDFYDYDGDNFRWEELEVFDVFQGEL